MISNPEEFRTEPVTQLPIVPDGERVIDVIEQIGSVDLANTGHFYRFTVFYLHDEQIEDSWDVDVEETPATLNDALSIAERESERYAQANKGAVEIVNHSWFLYDVDRKVDDNEQVDFADYYQREQSDAPYAGSILIPSGYLLVARVASIYPTQGNTPDNITDERKQRYENSLRPGQFKNYDLGGYDQSVVRADGADVHIDVEPKLMRH